MWTVGQWMQVVCPQSSSQLITYVRNIYFYVFDFTGNKKNCICFYILDYVYSIIISGCICIWNHNKWRETPFDSLH